MIIPLVYSIIATQFHTKQYANIITNVGNANRINQIAKSDIPNELWEIVCGKQDYFSNRPYVMIKTIFSELDEMKKLTLSEENKQKLDVAYRTCTTLHKNIGDLEKQMNEGSPVSQNESLLDEIRTITLLFSDVMLDYILSEIETASNTNQSIKQANINLILLQILIMIFTSLITLNSYMSLSNLINKPISDMKQLSTEIANGNLSARVKKPEIDEMVPLADNMNLMAEQINLLIKKNIEEQQNFQKAEMKALQAQITPHFLYNTFDTIIWLAEQEETEKVVKITKAFSNFLRISLSKGHEWITVQQELDHITNYLTIQKIRYADILNYEINLNEELADFKIIKLTLQPLVENAIYHGIKNKRGRGHLFVNLDYADENKQSIKISVSDDGAGFSPERLEQVKNELKSGDEDSERLSSVYGLYNVNKKLKLYYGDKTDGLQIESEYKKGSHITFQIPCIKGDVI